MATEREKANRNDVLAPILLLGIAAGVTEGAVVALSAARIGGGIGAVIAGFGAGAATIIAVLTIPCLALCWISGTGSARRLGRGLRAGLGGGEPGSPGLAIALGLGMIALSIVASARVGILLRKNITLPFAVFGQALTMAALLPLLFLTAAPLGSAVSALLDRLGITRRKWMAALDPGGVVFLLAAAAAVALLATLPIEFAPMPVLALAGFGAGLLPPLQRLIARLVGGRRAPILALVLFLASLSILAAIDGVPPTARVALLLRAPYSGMLLSLGQRVTDRDGDRFSSILLGGDCDDRNPQINPNAKDIPGNGIDENCSGADAASYRPPMPRQYARPKALPDKINIVVVLFDALRLDHAGFTGYPRRTTPFIDAFRQKATWFEKAYTPAPVTSSAILSLFTGRDFRQVPREYQEAKRYTVKPEAETVAEIVRARGYNTIGFTTDYVQRYIRGLGQGFNVWRLAGPAAGKPGPIPGSATFNTDDALKFLKTAPDDGRRPFFLFLHYIEPHASYEPHPPWNFGDSPLDRYDSEIAFCDSEIRRLISAIDARKDARNTAVFLVSDHGELFGDHGLQHHGRSLYETDVRVVLLARIPNAQKRTVTSPVILTDLAPTILELAGTRRPSDGQGQSLLPYIFFNHEDMKRPLFLFTELKQGAIQYNASAVVRWPFKYIRDRRTGVEELFEVSRDAGEERNLVERLPRELRELSNLLDSFEAFVGGNSSGGKK